MAQCQKYTKFEFSQEVLKGLSWNLQGIFYLSRPTLAPHMVVYLTMVLLCLSKAFFFGKSLHWWSHKTIMTSRNLIIIWKTLGNIMLNLLLKWGGLTTKDKKVMPIQSFVLFPWSTIYIFFSLLREVGGSWMFGGELPPPPDETLYY